MPQVDDFRLEPSQTGLCGLPQPLWNGTDGTKKTTENQHIRPENRLKRPGRPKYQPVIEVAHSGFQDISRSEYPGRFLWKINSLGQVPARSRCHTIDRRSVTVKPSSRAERPEKQALARLKGRSCHLLRREASRHASRYLRPRPQRPDFSMESGVRQC